MYERREPGCLAGLLQLFILRQIYNWAQRTFGSGQGGCVGMTIGVVLLVLFVCVACNIITGTNWFRAF